MRSERFWRIAPFIALVVGLGVTAWLVAAASLPAVLEGFVKVGWGALAVIAVRATTIAINGVAWALLLWRLCKVPTAVFVLLRWVRDAIDVLLPVAGIGGALIAARELTFWRVGGALALASVLADVLLQAIAQVVFALTGAVLLAGLVGPNVLLFGVAAGLALTAAGLIGFYALQSHSGAAVRLVSRAFAVLSPPLAARAQRAGPRFDAAVEQIWRGRRGKLVAVWLLHMLAWGFGTLEVFITLRFLGAPVTWAQAVVIEGLGTSISIAAMFIPGSWGAQEGGYILLGQLFGVPVTNALTLSLVKRIPDLVLGLPGLLAWYVLETRRLVSRRTPKG